jgi:hypothetical protein
LGGAFVVVSGITVDVAGNVLVSGQADDEAGESFWIVRQGTPEIHWIEQGGTWLPVSSLTWSTSDKFQLVEARPARAIGIAADAWGNVFVNGRGADVAGVDHGLVRKLSGVGPRLSVLRTAAGLQLAWSADARDFVLQSASTLTGGGNWQDFPAAPSVSGGVRTVSVIGDQQVRFFRLVQP